MRQKWKHILIFYNLYLALIVAFFNRLVILIYFFFQPHFLISTRSNTVDWLPGKSLIHCSIVLVDWSITVLVTYASYGSDMFDTSTVQKVNFKELIVFYLKKN